MTRRANSSAMNDGTQSSTESTAPYWITGWLLMKRDHQHRHGADLRRADQPGALGLVEGADEAQQHRGGDGRARPAAG